MHVNKVAHALPFFSVRVALRVRRSTERLAVSHDYFSYTTRARVYGRKKGLSIFEKWMAIQRRFYEIRPLRNRQLLAGAQGRHPSYPQPPYERATSIY
jgi:hypothetical protein